MKQKRSFSKRVIIAGPILVIAVFTAWRTFLGVREDLAQQRIAITAEWANVDSALQERAALIRDLAETGPTDLQREVVEAHAELQRGTTPEAGIKANERLSAALAKLLVNEDIGPHTKPNRASRQLQDQIKDSEERVAVARLKYNETLEHYNARIQTFPYNLVARIAGFRRNDAYFQTEPF